MKSYLAFALSSLLVLSGCGSSYDNTHRTLIKPFVLDVDGKKYNANSVLKVEEDKTTFYQEIDKNGKKELFYELVDDRNDGTVDYVYCADEKDPLELTRDKMTDEWKDINDRAFKTFRDMMEKK